jgi:tetratricopeptide (TPR) repeat protein
MTEDRRRFGSRLLAVVALWLLLSGLLMALSFVDVALVTLGILFIGGTAAGAIWGLRRIEFERRLAEGVLVAARVGRRLGVRLHALGIGGHVARFVARLAAGAWRLTEWVGVLVGRSLRAGWRRLRTLGVRRHARRLGAAARGRAAGMPSGANTLVARAVRSYAIAVYRLQAWTAQAFAAGTRMAAKARRPGARPPQESRQARRLNALGAQLRRQGEHEQAAEQHLVALEIVRDLGDEQAEAMTLNNLALALAHAGDEAKAVEHLEQAREVLHELGDEEHEAQVIANLGIVHRRQGRADVAETLLHEALQKLPPESTAYRQVEKELLRAS